MIWFDLDGVLADFIRGALSHYNAVMPDPCTGDVEMWCGFEERDYPDFWKPLGFDFWANLPPHHDGMDLLRSVERKYGADAISILSTPCPTRGCRDGKYAWVERHLPQLVDRVFLGKDKSALAHPRAVLVDDRDSVTALYAARGGSVVLVPRPWNTRSAECHSAGYFDVPALFDQLVGCVNLMR